jgi:hypothetical protein
VKVSDRFCSARISGAKFIGAAVDVVDPPSPEVLVSPVVIEDIDDTRPSSPNFVYKLGI